MDTVRGAVLAACLTLAVTVGIARGDTAGLAGTSSVTLEWTSPGDDGDVGVAARYDLRYALAPITPQNFGQATAASTIPLPAPAGTRQSAKITGLEPSRLYYFALKSVDDAGNWSLLSNVVFKTAPDPTTSPTQFPVSLSPPFPCPARDHIRCELTLPRDMVVHVSLFDVGGRQVQTLAEGRYPAGTSALQWNLIDEKGAKLGVGQYWIRGVLGGTVFKHRLTVTP